MYPRLFELFGTTPVNAYGTLILLGGLVAMVGVWWDARARGVGGGRPSSFVVDFYLALVFGAAIGGRLAHAVTSPRAYLRDPTQVFASLTTGFVFFGSLGFVILGWLWVARRHRLRFAVVCDIGATWMALGHAFGRAGCLMAGCCYGAPTTSGLGLAFPPDSVVYQLQTVPTALHATTPLHPTALYESLGLLGLFAVLLGFRLRRGIEPALRQSSRYALGYGLLRAGVEIFRGDLDRGFVFEVTMPALARVLALPATHPVALSVAQATALALVIAGITGLIVTRRGREPSSALPAPRIHPPGPIPGEPAMLRVLS